MTPSAPKITVCIITYNQVKFIEQCIQSVLDQVTSFDFEIVVGDDCSTDGTTAVIKKFENKHPTIIRAIYQVKNSGGTANYIAVHKAARGKYIAHMDGDDYALPNKLETLTKIFEKEHDVNILWHRNMILEDASGNLYPDGIDMQFQPPGGFTRKDLLSLGSVGVHSAMMYRASQRECIDFSHEYILDYYMNVECLNNGKGRWVDEFLGVYRVHAGLWTNQNVQSRKIFIEHLQYFLKKYPKEKKYINSLSLSLLLQDLKRLRRSSAFLLWLNSFHFLGFIVYLSSVSFRRQIKIVPPPSKNHIGIS